MSTAPLFDLTGKIALVTGASRGLGKHFALSLARAGADVAITSRTLDSLADTKTQIEALGRRALPIALDVRDHASISAGVAAMHAHFGRIDVLVNNAGCNVGPHGVTVNCLAPGWFKTAQNAVLYENAEWVSYLSEKIPLRRPGEIDDLTGPLLFLASDASVYMTGQTLLIDGGITVNDTRALAPKK
jgi:NAD(P)-dependent dehydrogenase (short-subunit alcohol dehydrogenase family)